METNVTRSRCWGSHIVAGLVLGLGVEGVVSIPRRRDYLGERFYFVFIFHCVFHLDDWMHPL